MVAPLLRLSSSGCAWTNSSRGVSGMDAPYPRRRVGSRLFHLAAVNRNANGYYREMPQLTQARNGSRSRRRGEVLERALYEATLAELTEVGYGGPTGAGIAARRHARQAARERR